MVEIWWGYNHNGFSLKINAILRTNELGLGIGPLIARLNDGKKPIHSIFCNNQVTGCPSNILNIMEEGIESISTKFFLYGSDCSCWIINLHNSASSAIANVPCFLSFNY